MATYDSGHVEINRLSERERIDYFARALRGHDFSCAIVAGIREFNNLATGTRCRKGSCTA